MDTKKEIYPGITQQMIDEAKAQYGAVKCFDLVDSEDNSHGCVLMKRPSPNVISEFEKWIDKNPLKARMALINGCVVSRAEEIKGWASDPSKAEAYAAAYDAAINMIPIGKAVAKKI